MNLLSSAGCGLFQQINLHFTQPQRGWRAAMSPRAPEQRPHPREQFIGAERFDQVIVRTGVETADAVLDLAPGCEHQHRYCD